MSQFDLKDIGTEQSADYRQFVTSVQPLPELTNTERETPPRQWQGYKDYREDLLIYIIVKDNNNEKRQAYKLNWFK